MSLNLTEIFQALIDGKKLVRESDINGEFIYMKDSKLYNANGSECWTEDLTMFNWIEYVEPVRTNNVKYYLLTCIDNRHIVCAFSKKEARQTMANYDKTCPNRYLWLKHAKCHQIKVNCNTVIL